MLHPGWGQTRRKGLKSPVSNMDWTFQAPIGAGENIEEEMF